MDKRTLIDILDRLAFACELLGLPQAMAYQRAGRSIRGLAEEPAALHARGELSRVPGIGPRIAEVIDEVARGEKPAALALVEADIPAGLFDLHRLPGLGPKKIGTLWRNLGITTLGELEYACQENRLLELPGFGAKTQAKIVAAVAQARQFEGWCRLDQAYAAGLPLVSRLREVFQRVQPVGAWRRGCELVRSVDLLVAHPGVDAAALRAALAADLEPDEAALRVAGTAVRLHLCPDPARFGTDAVLLTGSDVHLEALRARGLDPAAAYAEEDDLYAALGLHLPPPERREAHVPLVPRDQPAPPRLVELADLKGALHNHTIASDGLDTLDAMRAAAAARGLGYLGISDHSRTAAYAGGLDIDALRAQARSIDTLNQGAPACRLLKGVESDILADGALDYPPEVLADLDFVIASVHNRHGQGPEEMTARMVAAARNPWTSVVGHPTGRLLQGRAPTGLDIAAFLDACAEGGCAVELNASPQRLDLNAEQVEQARARGVPVSIGADAHSARALDNLLFGVVTARRGGLTPDDVLNTRPAEALDEWLRGRRTRAVR